MIDQDTLNAIKEAVRAEVEAKFNADLKKKEDEMEAKLKIEVDNKVRAEVDVKVRDEVNRIWNNHKALNIYWLGCAVFAGWCAGFGTAYVYFKIYPLKPKTDS